MPFDMLAHAKHELNNLDWHGFRARRPETLTGFEGRIKEAQH